MRLGEPPRDRLADPGGRSGDDGYAAHVRSSSDCRQHAHQGNFRSPFLQNPSVIFALEAPMPPRSTMASSAGSA